MTEFKQETRKPCKTLASRLPRTVAAVAALFLCALTFLSCDMFNKPLQDFLDEWTNVAKIMEHRFDGSYPATGGLTNLPSGGDRVITYYLVNPQNYLLDPSATFASSPSPNQGLDYSIGQDASDRTVLRLTLKDSYLQSLDGTGTGISPTVSITEPNSGRTFGSYTIPLRVNSAPNKAKNAVIMTWNDNSTAKYAVLFYLPEDKNNQYSLDRDVVSMTVSGFSGKYNTTFAIPASGDIGGVENTYAQGDFSPVTSGDSFIPLNGYRFVGIKTDFVVGSVVPSCTVTLRDSSGLESTTDVSTTTTKLTEVYVDPTNGNDGYPGSDILPVKTIGKAMEKLSGMTNTAIILVGDIDVQNTLAFTASYPNITLKGGATPVTLTYSGTGRAITVSGGKLTLGENITITGADDGAVELTGGEFVMETGSTLSGNGSSADSGGGVYVGRAGIFTMEGGTISDDIYVIGNFSLTETPTIAGNTITLASGASIDVNALTATSITDVTFIPSYTEGSPVLTNATEDICNFFTEFLGSVPTNELWWIGLGSGNGVLKTIEGTYDESTNTITVPTMPGTKDELQNTVNGSAESGVKVEITGGGTITVDSTVSVPGGADVAIKPGSGSTVDITADGATTVFDVQDGGSLTLGGGGGVVNVTGASDASPPTADGGEIPLINISGGGTVTIADNANIQNNKAGRGVTVTGGKLIMTGGSIKGNTGGYTYGSGVYVSGEGASFVMSGGEISGNTLELHDIGNRQGAGVCVLNGATFTLSDYGKIINNTGYEGAGVCVKNGASFTMKGGEISGNTGTGTSGGVYVVSSSEMTMSGGTITGNTAGRTYKNEGAGGVFIGSSCNFTGSTDSSTTASISENYVATSKIDVFVQSGGSGTYSPGNVQVGVKKP